MFSRWKSYIPIVCIILFSLFLFRNYFLKGLVPFPANLLVATYEPWKSYPVPEYPNGPPNKAMGFDNVRIYYPLKKVAIDTIKKFQPPLWNPYNFSGNVLLGTYQSAIFHPLSWLFLLLPQINAWSLIIILQPVLAALAMYAFLSTFSLHPVSRLIGALSYAFSGFFMTWWQESYMFTYSSMFLPLALFAVEKKRSLLLALSLAFSVFSGAFQMTFYVYIFTTLWILYRKQYTQLLFIMLSLLLSAIHLLPSLEAYYYSTRVSTDVKYIFDAYLLPWWQLVTLIAPDYFGNPATYNYFGQGFYHERLVYLGILPLILILTQLRKRGFSQIAFLVTLSLVMSLPTTWLLLYSLKLPLLSTMTPSRMMMLVTFIGSVLAAYGAEEYRRGFSKRTRAFLTVMLLLFLIAAGATPLVLHYLDDKNTTWIISLRNLVIPSASLAASIFALWLKPRYRKVGYVIFLLLIAGNAFLFAKKYLYFSERRFVYPNVAVFDALKQLTAYDRFWTYDTGYIEKNFASYYGVFSPEGYDAYMIRRYGEFLAYANSHGKSLTPDRSNALIQSTDHMSDILSDPYRTRTLQLLGVRYIIRKLVPDKNEQTMLPDPKELPRVWEDGTYAIHEYAQALPHVALYTDVRVETDPLPALFDADTNIHETIILEEKPDNVIPQPGRTGSVRIVSYTPNAVTLESQTNGDTVLFLSDTYYPGWKAYVDSVPSKLYRANYAFRAVAVPTGDHTVEFRYEPDSWKLGIYGTATGVLLCILLMVWPKKQLRGSERNRTAA